MEQLIEPFCYIANVKVTDKNGKQGNRPLIRFQAPDSGLNFNTYYVACACASVYNMFLDYIAEKDQIEFEKQFKEIFNKLIDEGLIEIMKDKPISG